MYKPVQVQVHFILLSVLLTITACRDGNNNPPVDNITQHNQPVLPKDGKPGPVTNVVATTGDGNVNISWQAPTTGGKVDYYIVDKTIDDKKSYSNLFTNINSNITSVTDQTAQAGINHIYRVTAANNINSGSAALSNVITPAITNVTPKIISSKVYFTSPNLDAPNNNIPTSFGRTLAISTDGKLLAVSEYNGDPLVHTNSSVVLFDKRQTAAATALPWKVKQTIIPTTPGLNVEFGNAIAFSANGFNLAVADYRASNGGVTDSGVVEIYSPSATGNWAQVETLVDPSTTSGKFFGTALAFSRDGYSLAISGTQLNTTNTGSTGKVFIFKKRVLATTANNPWMLSQTLVSQQTTGNQYFGIAISFSHDGTTLAIGETATNPTGAGSVQIFTQTNLRWEYAQVLKSITLIGSQLFAKSIAFSADNKTLAIAETKANTATTANTVQLFTKTGTKWIRTQVLKSTVAAVNGFGAFLAFNPKSNLLTVSDVFVDTTTLNSGKVLVFKKIGSNWLKSTTLISHSAADARLLGTNVAFNPADNTLIVGESGGGIVGVSSSGLINIYDSAQF